MAIKDAFQLDIPRDYQIEAINVWYNDILKRKMRRSRLKYNNILIIKNAQIQTQQTQEQLETEHLAKEKIAAKEHANQQCLLALPLHTIRWYPCYSESTKNQQQPQKQSIGIACFNKRYGDGVPASKAAQKEVFGMPSQERLRRQAFC